MSPAKLWTKDFIILAFVNFFIAINFYLLMVMVSVFAVDHFQASPGKAGLAAGIFVIGTLIARVFSGKWIERMGRKRMLVFGLVFSFVMSLFYFGATSIFLLMIIRFFHGAAFGMATTAAMTIVAQVVAKERRGEGIGYFMLSVTLATAIGPFLGMTIHQNGSFP